MKKLVIYDKFIQRLKVVDTFNLSSNGIYWIKALVLLDKSRSIDTSHLFFVEKGVQNRGFCPDPVYRNVVLSVS